MRIGIVPLALVEQTRRLDADFYIGNQAEQKVTRAQAALVKARQRLKNAKRELKKRNEERRKNRVRLLVVRLRVQPQG